VTAPRSVTRRRLATLVAAVLLAALGAAGPVLPASALTTPRAGGLSVMGQDDLAHQGGAYDLPADPALTARAPRAAASPAFSPRARTTPGGQGREVFGYLPYWELGTNTSDVQYGSVSTVAYFGLSLDASGNFINDSGFTGWNSSALSSVITSAHDAGDRVVVTGKSFDNAAVASIVNNPTTNGQAAVTHLVQAVQARGIDGVSIDFEGADPSLQGAFTNWIHQLSDQLRAAVPGAQLTIATYASAASTSNGFWRVDALAPFVDAFFVMGYDFNKRNTLPNAPLTGPYTYTDSGAVDQFISRVGGDGSKVILGVPYYGYKYSTQNSGFNAPLNGGCGGSNCASVTYADIQADFGCASQLSRNWDGASQTPWASWLSPASGDPCGSNLNTTRELYYDDAASLGAKYDLVNNRGIRGAGIWALGFDHGYGELWQAISAHIYDCPVTPAQPLAYTHPASLVAGMGTDCTLWAHQSTGAGFTPLGNLLTGAPAIAQAAGQAPLFIVTSNDHNLWVRSGTSAWSPLVSGGAVFCLDNPAATVVGGTLYVACVGGDRALWVAQAPIGSGLPRVPIAAFSSLGGILSAGPAVAQVAGRVTYVGLGTDRRAWSRDAGAGWSPTPWYCQGHPALAADGGVAYFACNGTDSALWYASNTGGGWSPPASLGGVLSDGPGVAAWSGNPVFFGQGGDGAVWERGLVAGWSSDGGQVRHGVGALAVR
jgi:spore germination protein YaaH